jgi:hypothetical protein
VRYRLLGKKSSAKHRENLSNMYMKRIFREVYGVRQVPEVVLEAKRNHLHVLRLLRGD